ncbi:ccaat-binding factor-related [Holotrichia oblita]|uniref:Ccaat-binding factor-related n=1 Tax=Holotrichia oblita TaxID=644536 RepID=A0ACB9TUL4_HOLOL|nr:ccaat-binding factor-related [Holotrichia oblita]
MKFKKRNRPISDSDDLQTTAFKDDRKLWFNEIADDPADFKLPSDDLINTLREEAKRCLDSEVANFNTKNAKSNSDYRWMKTATQKGTVSDKIAASTVLIQDNPITHLDILRNLVSMVKVGKKKECIVVIDTLTELFTTCLLKQNLKLKFFGQRPLTELAQICSGNARTRQQYLTYWYFEDQLKEIYSNFVVALNKAAHDTLDANKEKAIGAIFYSALYKKLNDPKLLTTTHQAIFLNLIYKSLLQDTEIFRIKTFIKRLLQLASFMQPSFACGVLYLISQLLTKRPSLQAIKLEQVDSQSLAKFEDNEEEKYADVVDNEVFVIEDDNENDKNALKSTNEDEKEEKPDIEILNANTKTCPSWYHCSTTIKEEKKNPTCYDPFNRNPLFAGAEYTAYFELLNLKDHYHPTVSLYADNLLQGKPINYSGDPLKDFSLIRFLDRFVFKNPKKINSNDGSHPTFGIRKKYIPSGLRSLALNSERYLQQKEKNIPPEELYLYKYMQKKVGEKIKNSEDSDLESVASEEFEEMLDKMNNFKDVEDDLDYMKEIESSLKNKSTKNKNSRKTINNSDESDDDNDTEDSEGDEVEGDEFSGSEIDDDIELDNEDKELIQDLDDDDDVSDMEFESDDNDNLKTAKTMKKKGDINGVFASAEEFASILEDEGNNSKMGGRSNTLSNKENAAVKQIEWEQKRNHWIQGYNKAVGKTSRKFEHNKDKYNKKRPFKSRGNSKSKKPRI